jgi:hypothetical protein
LNLARQILILRTSLFHVGNHRLACLTNDAAKGNVGAVEVLAGAKGDEELRGIVVGACKFGS